MKLHPAAIVVGDHVVLDRLGACLVKQVEPGPDSEGPGQSVTLTVLDDRSNLSEHCFSTVEHDPVEMLHETESRAIVTTESGATRTGRWWPTEEDARFHATDIMAVSLRENGDPLASFEIDTRPLLERAIEHARELDDLDAACLVIQDALGQTDGGTASIFFSGWEEKDWLSNSEGEREDVLREYVEYEQRFLEAE